jgi:hypothetical protein
MAVTKKQELTEAGKNQAELVVNNSFCSVKRERKVWIDISTRL